MRVLAGCPLGFVLCSAIGLAAASAGQQQCRGIEGTKCKNGTWCDVGAGMCKAADAGGVCIDLPEVCIQAEPDATNPVCGCDGTTYPSDCNRQAAKVANDHDGGCQTP
jgi:hypothetical protein